MRSLSIRSRILNGKAKNETAQNSPDCLGWNEERRLLSVFMIPFHVVTFYEITYVKDAMKNSGRDVERIATQENLSGTFFSTPQGVNATSVWIF